MSQVTFPGLFTTAELTDAVNKLPRIPLRLSGLFEEKGVTTTSVAIDVKDGRLFLVKDQDRKGDPESMADKRSKRSTKVLTCAHLPLSDSVLPSDIQDVRAFGTTELVGPAQVINDRMEELKTPIEMTIEYHRLGAIKGVVVDADGTTPLHDYYSLFDITKNTQDISFPADVPVQTNPVLKAILDGKRQAERKAKGLPIARFEALVGSGFYDALTGHELVREAFELWQAQQQNFGDNDYRRRGFTYGGVTWIEVSEVINNKPLVADDKAHMYPIAPGVFKTRFAPANWTSTVNTLGLPFYAQMEERRMDRGYDLEVQSNPLCLCMYPETLVEFTAK